MDEKMKEETITPSYALDLIVEEHKTEKKRLWIALLICFIALIGTNAGWIIYENSYVDSITVSQDTPNGNNNYVGRDGDITNGTPNYNKDANKENP